METATRFIQKNCLPINKLGIMKWRGKFFLLIPLFVGIAGWRTYESEFSEQAHDRHRSIAMCDKVQVGMTELQVYEIAKGPKNTAMFSKNFASIGFGSNRCIVTFESGLVKNVGNVGYAH